MNILNRGKQTLWPYKQVRQPTLEREFSRLDCPIYMEICHRTAMYLSRPISQLQRRLWGAVQMRQESTDGHGKFHSWRCLRVHQTAMSQLQHHRCGSCDLSSEPQCGAE